MDLLFQGHPGLDQKRPLRTLSLPHSYRNFYQQKRLWRFLLTKTAGIDTTKRWGEISTGECNRIQKALQSFNIRISGKGTFKEEFVTCGGVTWQDECGNSLISRNMESEVVSGLFFAGELLDVDGITGGYNFQNAWTTGCIAGQSIAERVRRAS